MNRATLVRRRTARRGESRGWYTGEMPCDLAHRRWASRVVERRHENRSAIRRHYQPEHLPVGDAGPSRGRHLLILPLERARPRWCRCFRRPGQAGQPFSCPQKQKPRSGMSGVLSLEVFTANTVERLLFPQKRKPRTPDGGECRALLKADASTYGGAPVAQRDHMPTGPFRDQNHRTGQRLPRRGFAACVTQGRYAGKLRGYLA
jgi:hypothetical protein